MGQSEFRSPAAYQWPVEIRVIDGDDGPLIAGYAVPYNQRSVDLGGFVEEFAPGAFGESLNGDVRALWQHDKTAVLGRTKANTLRLWDDERGVAFELTPPDTQIGRDAVTSIRRGDVDQMSFGFVVQLDEDKRGEMWTMLDDGMALRRVTKAEMIEVSPVTWAAYPQTEVGVRHDEIYGVLPEIPADLRAQDDAGDTDDDQARARVAHRMRLLDLAEAED